MRPDPRDSNDGDSRPAAPGDERTTAKADRDLLKAAASGAGLTPITSSEQFESLLGAAERTMTHFRDTFAVMTAEQAAFVRRLRCEDHYTWRAVAETCDLEWGGSWGSNQLAGMAICERAAEMHDEDYMNDPWN